jgi:endoglucanase
MTHRHTLSGAVCALMFVLSGCGGDGAKGPSENDPPKTTSSSGTKPAAKSAASAKPITEGLYTFTSSCNGKGLALQNGNPNPWDNAVVGDTPAKWQISPAGDGSYIIRAAGTQSALQTAYGKTDNQTDVDLWTYSGGNTQRWNLTEVESSLYEVTLAAAPGMALDLKYAGTGGQNEAWLYTANSSCAQRWTLQPTTDNSGGGGAADAFAMQKKLGRGINFGNILEASPGEGSWGISLSEELFNKAKEAGFATIRLPVRWSNHAQAQAPYTIDASFFARVDYAINAALSRGMNIVVNMHHYRQLCGENLDNGEFSVPANVLDERFAALWQQIAARYQSQPNDRVLFELYNEPNSNCNGARWNSLLKRAYDEVRKTNPQRFIVIGPSSWNSADALAQLQLPNDPRIIVTIHNYNPFKFTHQGASWAGPDANSWLGTQCCDAAQTAEIVAPLDKAKQWAGNRWPLWLGEFGAYEKAPFDARVRHTRLVRDEAEKRGITWAYWEIASGFGIWDPNAKVWRTALRDALTAP